jgi:transcriptional regulator with XRE-family HTH domain
MTYVGQLERGIRNPTFEIVERLARALKVKPLDLLK